MNMLRIRVLVKIQLSLNFEQAARNVVKPIVVIVILGFGDQGGWGF